MDEDTDLKVPSDLRVKEVQTFCLPSYKSGAIPVADVYTATPHAWCTSAGLSHFCPQIRGRNCGPFCVRGSGAARDREAVTQVVTLG